MGILLPAVGLASSQVVPLQPTAASQNLNNGNQPVSPAQIAQISRESSQDALTLKKIDGRSASIPKKTDGSFKADDEKEEEGGNPTIKRKKKDKKNADGKLDLEA